MTDLTPSPCPVLRIGDYRVEPTLDEVCREGVVSKLEPRSMGVLLCLARHAGQVVSVDRLLEEVWGDVVVNPDSVYQAVASLRRTLGDDAKVPRYIANVVRRGYRLVAPVSVWEESGTASSTGDRNAENPATVLPRPAAARSHASIAILPFANLTGDLTRDYLGDGIAAELINTLTRAPGWFKVAARTSAFSYKGRHIDVRQIARELDVEAVLEGSVLCADERIRITAQLVDGHTGHQLWSRSYERKFSDWSAHQDELIVSIADALIIGGSSLLSTERKPPTRNLRAFQFFLQARSLNTQPTEHNLRSALELLSQAIELDPTFARAWQGMAVTRGFHFVTMDYPLPNALNDAEQAAHRALALDGSLAGVRAVLGFIHACRGHWIKAEAEIRESLAFLSNDPEVHLVHSVYVTQSAGHLRKAIDEAEAACRLTPLTPVYTFYVGIAKARVGQYTEALQWIQRSIADGLPESAGPVSDALAHLAQQQRRYEVALGHMMNALSPAWRAAGGAGVVRLFYSALAQPSGNKAAVAALRKLETGLRPEEFGQVDSKRLIMWYTNLGALDFAYEAADRALERFALSGTVGIAWGVLWIDEMRPFRRDARFQAFVERLGLMEYWNQYGPPDNCELLDGRLMCP